jgi:hypothetical protein
MSAAAVNRVLWPLLLIGLNVIVWLIVGAVVFGAGWIVGAHL